MHLSHNTRGTSAEWSVVLGAVVLLGVAPMVGLGGSYASSIAGSTRGATMRPTASTPTPSRGTAVGAQAAGGTLVRALAARAGDVTSWFVRDARLKPPMGDLWLEPSAVSSEARAAGVPSRFVVAPGARELHGSLIDTLATNLTRGDQLADDVVSAMQGLSKEERNALIDRALDVRGVPPETPEAVRAPLGALMKQVNTVPEWVDWKNIDRGADTMVRTGPAGLVSLMGYSLPLTYTSPAGVKPLVWTKDLLEQTPRRLAETLDFVTKTSTRGSLRPGADGWRTTVRVRLIHAQVRHALSNMPHWDAGAWGTPINQTEMVGTNLAFSSIFMDGTRKLGARYTPAEAQSIMDLWRYSGYLLGVDEPLLARSDTQGRRIAAAILATQAPPNEDSRRLIEALTRVSLTANPPAALGDVQRSMTHYLIGDYYANELNLTADVGRDAARATVPAAGRSADLLRGLPFGNRVSVRSGRLLWKSITKGLLGKNPSEFLIPEHGQGVRSAALP